MKGRGYCLFPVLGRDPGRRLCQAGPGDRRPGARPSMYTQQRSCVLSSTSDLVLVRTIGFQRSQVATWFWCRDIKFGVATWRLQGKGNRCRDTLLKSRHGWQCGEVATWLLVSRPGNPTVGRSEVATSI